VSAGANIVCDVLDLPPIKVGDCEGKPNRIERWLGRQLSFYLPYLRFTGRFARSLPAPASLDLDDLRRLTAGYLAGSRASDPKGENLAASQYRSRGQRIAS
jgi:hypothetical protein